MSIEPWGGWEEPTRRAEGLVGKDCPSWLIRLRREGCVVIQTTQIEQMRPCLTWRFIVKFKSLDLGGFINLVNELERLSCLPSTSSR